MRGMQSLRSGGRRSSEDGAAALEFAVVLPILVLLVLGIVDFSRGFQAHIALTQAVREAVRPLALSLTEDGVGPLDLAQQRFDATVDTSSTHAASLTIDADCEGNATNAVVEGTATVNFVTPLGNFIGGATSFAVESRAEMRCGG